MFDMEYSLHMESLSHMERMFQYYQRKGVRPGIKLSSYLRRTL